MASFCWAVTCVCLFLSFEAEANENKSCLMCHKYRFAGRIDENGKRINYHVDEIKYEQSVHRNVPCQDCHTYITKFPHDPVREEVNCATQCHIKPPFASNKFSHQKIINTYNESAHGIRPDDPPELKKAKPDCKFCHLNPLYTRVDEEMISFDTTLRRCLNCHQEKGVTQAYKHMTHRLRKKTSRTPQEIVQLCSKCHQDTEFMKKANADKERFDVVETYNRSIHGKSVMLGSQQTADCVSCHASNLLHDINKQNNKKATIYKDNLMQTCKQCHAQTNSWLIQIAVHPRPHPEGNPILHVTGIFLRLALYGSLFSMVGLLLLETRGRRKDGIKFQLRRGTSWRGKSKRRRGKKSVS
jgi:hypothetical protein